MGKEKGMSQGSQDFEAEWARFEAYLEQKVGELSVTEEGGFRIVYGSDYLTDKRIDLFNSTVDTVFVEVMDSRVDLGALVADGWSLPDNQPLGAWLHYLIADSTKVAALVVRTLRTACGVVGPSETKLTGFRLSEWDGDELVSDGYWADAASWATADDDDRHVVAAYGTDGLPVDRVGMPDASISEEPAKRYWRLLYPEQADENSTSHWYGRWRTYEQSIGLWDKRERLRQWYEDSGQTLSDPHVTTVTTFHATPLRSLTAKVCLGCMWASRDLNAEHSQGNLQ